MKTLIRLFPRSSLIWVCTICPNLSVKIFMVYCCKDSKSSDTKKIDYHPKNWERCAVQHKTVKRDTFSNVSVNTYAMEGI